jgi:membrane associated rhomboid family serine protease
MLLHVPNEVMLENIAGSHDEISRKLRVLAGYRTALNHYKSRRGLARILWVTWIVTIGTIATWCYTADQIALASGAHNLRDVITNILANAISIQQNDTLAAVLISYGAKDNSLILAGQYWRFVTPIFLHVNLLHIALNMLNFFVLGIFLERLVGHLRFLLIYLVTGVISIIASFYFAPQEISVGASGAIFGLVGAYSIFVLAHRRALRGAGIPALVWLVCIIGANLSVGFFIADVDNFAHIGGLLSGFLLGWWFMPRYVAAPGGEKAFWIDLHRLSRRWPLAILTILGTILLAMIALHFTGG